MAKQKKVSKATEDEHMALEAAMNELTKQTDELLKQAKPKEEKKPELPKKQPETKPAKKVVPHKKGASLDIVGHGPSSPRKKTSQNVDTKVNDEELLPATAGLSYNEQPESKVYDAPKIPAIKKPTASKPASDEKSPMIQSHVGKRIEPTGAAVTSKAIKSQDVAEKMAPESEEKSSEESSKSEPETKIPSKKPEEHIKVSEDDKEEVVKVGHKAGPKADKPDTSDSPESSDTPDKAAVSEQDEPDTNPSKFDAKKAEVEEQDEDDDEDDGIIKMKDEDAEDSADSEKSKDDKKKVPSYDVAEYQAQLHDWSKLSRNSHWPFLILILLLAVAGGLMYLYFSGNLPQFFSA